MQAPKTIPAWNAFFLSEFNSKTNNGTKQNQVLIKVTCITERKVNMPEKIEAIKYFLFIYSCWFIKMQDIYASTLYKEINIEGIVCK